MKLVSTILGVGADELKKNPQVVKLMDCLEKYKIDIDSLNEKQISDVLELCLLSAR